MGQAGGARGRSFAWPWLAGGLALALLVASLAAVGQRRAIAAWLIGWWLRGAGLAPVELEVARIDRRGLELRDLRIGSRDELRIEAVDLDWDPTGLRAGRAAAARVRGLQLRGRLDAGGISLGPLDPLLRGTGQAPAQPGALPVLLPLDALGLERARIELESPRGRFAAELAAHLARVGAALEGSAAAQLELPRELAAGVALAGPAPALEASLRLEGGAIEAALGPLAVALDLGAEAAPGRLEIEVPRLALRGALGPAGPLRATGEGGRVALPWLGVEARPIALEATLDPAAPLRLGEARLALRELRDRAEPPRFPTLELEARARPGDAGLELELDVSDAGRRLRFEARGGYSPAAGSAQARLHLHPVEFAPGALQPGDLLHPLAALVSSVRGSVELLGRASVGAGAPPLELELALRDLAATTPLGKLEGLNAVVALDGAWPLRTPPGQVVSVARLDFGLPLSDGVVRFGLGAGGVLEIERAEWRFAGGAIRTAGSFDLGAPEQALVLQIEGLDLAQLLGLLALDGLSGEGTLDGRLPLERRDVALAVRGGELHARAEGGVLRYRPSAAAKAAAGAKPLAVLHSALENFQFRTLVLGLDGETSGALETRLDLSGANPDLEGGRPVEFHLSVESELADLLREAKLSAGIPEAVQQRLEGFAERARAGAARPGGEGDTGALEGGGPRR